MGDRVTEAAIEHPVTPTLAKTANVLAKGALLLLLLFAVLHPDQANLRDKAAGMRAILIDPLWKWDDRDCERIRGIHDLLDLLP